MAPGPLLAFGIGRSPRTLAAMLCHHYCCRIPANRYHTHTAPPERCDPCADARAEIDGLSDIVTAVLDRVAPEIPGLPAEPDQLVDRVIAVTADVHHRARAEPGLDDLSPARRRTVLAARVGIALAFATPTPPAWSPTCTKRPQ